MKIRWVQLIDLQLSALAALLVVGLPQEFQVAGAIRAPFDAFQEPRGPVGQPVLSDSVRRKGSREGNWMGMKGMKGTKI